MTYTSIPVAPAAIAGVGETHEIPVSKSDATIRRFTTGVLMASLYP
jgi:hypothetical protein